MDDDNERDPLHNLDNHEWVPDDALQNMVMERSLHVGERPTAASKRLLEENAPIVTQSLLHLAIHSSSERTRLDAGKYVLDRVLGRVGEEVPTGEETPLSTFVSEVMNDIASV